MDEHWAAVIVSAVTGGFGLLGIVVTQLIARYKTRRLNPKADDVMLASEGKEPIPRLDYLAALRQQIKENQDMERDAHRDIKDMLRDGFRDMKHEFEGIERSIDRITITRDN